MGMDDELYQQHIHCESCVQPLRCWRPHQPTAADSWCAPVSCPAGCGQLLHACKLPDHQLVCASALVECINAGSGCSALMPRRERGVHLHRCPASVVVCPAEWWRWRRPSGGATVSANPALARLKLSPSVHAPLDLAMAWRDQHRLLHEARSPAPDSYAAPADRQSDDELHDPYGDTECAHRLARSLCRLCRDDLPPPADQLRVRRSWQSVPSPDRPGQLVWQLCELPEPVKPLLQTTEHLDLDAMLRLVRIWRKEAAVGVRQMQTALLESLRGDDSDLFVRLDMDYAIHSLHPTTPVRHLVRCAQPLRRDEFRGHYRLLHEHLATPEWLQPRCPLLQYGCSYWTDRLVPAAGCQYRLNVDDDGHVAVVFDPASQRPDDGHKPHRSEESAQNGHPDRTDGLMALPVELLIRIAGHLDGCGLARLARTCHRLRDVCEQLLDSRGLVLLHWTRLGAGRWQCERRVTWRFSCSCRAPREPIIASGVGPHMADHLRKCRHLYEPNLNRLPFSLMCLPSSNIQPSVE